MELLVLRVTCIHTFHRELLSVHCVLNSGFSLALVDESDRLPGYKELRASFVSPQAHFKKTCTWPGGEASCSGC